MSDYRSILAACGWIVELEEPPLIAERVAKYASEKIEQLEAVIKQAEKDFGTHIMPPEQSDG